MNCLIIITKYILVCFSMNLFLKFLILSHFLLYSNLHTTTVTSYSLTPPTYLPLPGPGLLRISLPPLGWTALHMFNSTSYPFTPTWFLLLLSGSALDLFLLCKLCPSSFIPHLSKCGNLCLSLLSQYFCLDCSVHFDTS